MGAEDDFPPRKFYDLKPTEFERVNPPARSAPQPPAQATPVTPEPTPPPPVEASAPAPTPAASTSPTAAFDPGAPIRLNEIIAAANVPGKVLRDGNEATGRGDRALRGSALGGSLRKNEVHALLAENLARETAAGLNRVSDAADRRNHRFRDWVYLMLATNVPLFFLGIYGIHSTNAMLAVSSFAGVGLCSAAITWIMWVVMDKY